MNWAAIAAIVSGCGLLVTVLGIAYTSGKLTQRIDDTEKVVGGHAETLAEHAARLGVHDVDLGRLKEWKDGFNAAARVSGNKEVQ